MSGESQPPRQLMLNPHERSLSSMKLPENVKKAASAIVTMIMTFWAIQEIAKNYGVALALPSPPAYQLILTFVALTAFPLWIGYQIHAWRFKRMKAPTETERTKTSEVTLSTEKGIARVEAKTDALKPWRQRQLMKLGFQSLVKQDLLAIERQFDFRAPKRIDFESWNDTDADLKKQYIDNPAVYRILENIVKVLNEWNAELNRASLLMLEPNSVIWVYAQSCKKYYEKLREFEFLS
jgi:hypothetical protein